MAIECKKDIVYEHLKREILGKLLSPGSRLPCEVELAKRLKVGHVTLRSALAKLASEGLVERMPGKGTFVTEISERNTILLILPDGTDNLETPSRYVAAGIEEFAVAQSVTLERCPASLWNSFSEQECREMIQQHQISGVLLETGHGIVSDNVITRLKLLNLPVVIPHGLPQDAENTGFSVLRTDERTAFASALRYLKKSGHRIIATMLLELPSEQLTAVRGFTYDELKEFYQYNDFKNDESLIRFVQNKEEVMIKTVREWMLGPLPPTAIMCHSDRVAMRVYQALKQLNIRIPQQVSVMGYSNYLGSQLLRPPLTTIDIQFKQCGQMALKHLLNAKEWYIPGIIHPEIFTPFELIERGSVESISSLK